MGKAIDLTGQVFGRWVVIERAANTKGGAIKWICQCECGKVRVVYGWTLRKGVSKSCGCLHNEQLVIRSKQTNTKHGWGKTRLYNIWNSMKQRCLNKNSKDYRRYGGRGITVCKEWVESFEAFRDWAIANGYADNLTIDRINNNGNYEPSNCRWTTNKRQQNNKRNNHLLTYRGETHSISEWAKKVGISVTALKQRIYAHWTIEKALTTPTEKTQRRNLNA